MPRKPTPPPSQPEAKAKPNIFGLGQGLEESAVAFLPGVRVEVLSNKQAIVDGCRGIIEYSDTLIRLSADRLILKFTGTDLEIKCLSQQNMVIEGQILSVEYS